MGWWPPAHTALCSSRVPKAYLVHRTQRTSPVCVLLPDNPVHALSLEMHPSSACTHPALATPSFSSLKVVHQNNTSGFSIPQAIVCIYEPQAPNPSHCVALGTLSRHLQWSLRMCKKRMCTCMCDWVPSLYSRKLTEHGKPDIMGKKIIV